MLSSVVHRPSLPAAFFGRLAGSSFRFVDSVYSWPLGIFRNSFWCSWTKYTWLDFVVFTFFFQKIIFHTVDIFRRAWLRYGYVSDLRHLAELNRRTMKRARGLRAILLVDEWWRKNQLTRQLLPFCVSSPETYEVCYLYESVFNQTRTRRRHFSCLMASKCAQENTAHKTSHLAFFSLVSSPFYLVRR